MPITKEQAEQVLAAVKERHEGWFDATDPQQGPKLVQDWDWLESGPTPWAIVWEEGPDEWAYRFVMGGVNVELASLAADFKAALGGITPEEPYRQDGVSLEVVTFWALSVYGE